MKKLISLMLALVFVFSMATVAFAATTDPDSNRVDGTADQVLTFTFQKKYVDKDSEVVDYVPRETLKFKVTSLTNGGPEVTMKDTSIDGSANPAPITLTVGSASACEAGKYYYKIEEETPDVPTQGVTYSNGTILVTVWVYYEEVNSDDGATTRVLKKSVTLTKEDDKEKVDTIVNKYDLGHLTVQKTISGNMASDKAAFDITVKFTSDKPVASSFMYTDSGFTNIVPYTAFVLNSTTNKYETGEYTITLVADETVSFDNIPAGVEYTVVEASKHLYSGTGALSNDIDKDYTATYFVDNNKKETAYASDSISAKTTDAVVVNNDKTAEVSTGITLDSLPFVLILAVCAGAAVLFVIKRRNSVDF